MKKLLVYIALFFVLPAYGQKEEDVNVLRTQDSLPLVEMDEVVIFEYKSDYEQSRYNHLKRDIYMVYPYAQLVAHTLEKVDSTLNTLPGKRARKKYLKQKEKELKARYKEPLKDLNMTEGHLLLKLIHRETDKNCYYLIKRFKSGFNARMWQTVSYIFGYDLKEEYDPEAPENRDIERILTQLERSR